MKNRKVYFQLMIESCRNHSWKGEFRHQDRDYSFSSEMELLIAMDHILKETGGEMEFGTHWFDGLDGPVKDPPGFMPLYDPDMKRVTVQSELGNLEKQESALHAEIGRRVLARDRGQYPVLESRLKLVQADLAEARAKVKAAQTEQDQVEPKRQMPKARYACPQCGCHNPEGVKFCQECGAKMDRSFLCPGCGTWVLPGVRFCGECGARLEEQQ